MTKQQYLTPEEELANLTSAEIEQCLNTLTEERDSLRRAGNYTAAASVNEHLMALQDVAPRCQAAADLRDTETAITTEEILWNDLTAEASRCTARLQQKREEVEQETKRLQEEVKLLDGEHTTVHGRMRRSRERVAALRADRVVKTEALAAAEAGLTVDELRRRNQEKALLDERRQQHEERNVRREERLLREEEYHRAMEQNRL